MYKVMTVLLPSFQAGYLYSFSCLIALGRTSAAIANKGDVTRFVLFLS